MSKKVVGSNTIDEAWGPAIKESGLHYSAVQNVDDAVNSKADFFLIDVREPTWADDLSRLKSKTTAPILSLIGERIDRGYLSELKSKGSEGCVGENTPPEEVALRVKTMLGARGSTHKKESRAAQRVWFQQKVEFSVFDKAYSAWSTTLSETGIFLHTNLSFPLYSNIKLKFQLWGEGQPFECDGVIVRQEVVLMIMGLLACGGGTTP